MISVQRLGASEWQISRREDRIFHDVEIMELEPAAHISLWQGVFQVYLADYNQPPGAKHQWVEWRAFHTLREAIDAVALHLTQQRKAS